MFTLDEISKYSKEALSERLNKIDKSFNDIEKELRRSIACKNDYIAELEAKIEQLSK